MAFNTTSGGRERIWTCLYEESDSSHDGKIAELSAGLGIHSVTAKLLYNRGFDNVESAQSFFCTDASCWHSPYLMRDMEKGVARILAAVERGECIAIYGDYDVDGVTSVSSLYTYLTAIGADVICYIPNRKEGYGMSRGAVERLATEGVRLIITVDTGITATDEIAFAAELGVDTVVTDHHECHGELPECCAVINPHRADCEYPFKELAGVGVIFKVICATELARTGESDRHAIPALAEQLLDFVAIGTVADVMPLLDENRFIVLRGLDMIENTERAGLSALLDAISGSGKVKTAGGGVQGTRPRRKVNTGLIGYGVAPRINAAGRISDAMRAVRLMLAESATEAERLAEELCAINAQRQVEENRIAEQAFAMIEADMESRAATTGKMTPPPVVVLADNGWAQGIIGIVSSRITEKYGVPSILISFDGAMTGDPHDEDVGKGSGRSVKGMNLVDALAHCEDVLVRFGGHELAAGLSVRRGDIDAFRKRICEYAQAILTPEMTAVRYEAECELASDEITMSVAEEIARLEPFGVANPTPSFMLCDATVHRIIPMGAGKHTKLMLWKDGILHQAVYFGMPTAKIPFGVGDPVDLLFQLNVNEYQGTRTVQLIIQDVREAVSYREECARHQARLEEILGGGSILEGEGIVPDRDDIAEVYKLLRQEVRMGAHSFSIKDLISKINGTSVGDVRIGYVKTKLILCILDELKICSVREPDDGIYIIDIDFNAPKTSIDSSELLQKLRAQTVRATK
ncbi:MAG: single-stranded-DNA-specific exonuclease RecJ [Ruminococcaceae bacterium]|nr:single-stranded-DNA-specific exonuclease RecJ [Oscillospiraceae bacterium]